MNTVLKLLAELGTACAQFLALLAVAEKQGRLMSALGKELVSRPRGEPFPFTKSRLGVENDDSVVVPHEYNNHQMMTGKLPSAGDLRKMIDEIREAERRLEELDVHLTAFGIQPG